MITYRNFNTPEMWSEMSNLRREMNRLFGGIGAATGAGVFPALNLYDNGDGLIVRAEIPGFKSQDLDIRATVNSLTIKGERTRTPSDDNASFHRRERSYGTFSRTINLPHEIDPDKIDAKLRLGVLEVTLPKAEEEKPRKIMIEK